MERANAESSLDKRSRVQTSVVLTVGAVIFQYETGPVWKVSPIFHANWSWYLERYLGPLYTRS